MSRIESITSFPKLIIATATTATSAVVSGASQAAQLPSPHWGQVAVWICTALAGLGTLGLAALRGYIELHKFISNRRRAAKYRARAKAAAESSRRLP